MLLVNPVSGCHGVRTVPVTRRADGVSPGLCPHLALARRFAGGIPTGGIPTGGIQTGSIQTGRDRPVGEVGGARSSLAVS